MAEQASPVYTHGLSTNNVGEENSQMRKTIIAVSAVLALTASYVMAGTHTNLVTVTGTTYVLEGPNIVAIKFTDSTLISEDGITNKGARLLFLDEGAANDALVVAATAQGHVLYTNVVVHTPTGISVVATNSAHTMITADSVYTFDLTATNGVTIGQGSLFATETEVAGGGSIKANGAFATIIPPYTSTNLFPGTVSISVSGAFKAPAVH
jgi:hypothetical protein